jgi:hypothetical protein
MKSPTVFLSYLFVGSWILTMPDPVLAIQTHGPPEGLYVHQIAHVGFLVAMIYICLKTRKRRGAGWGLIRLSFIFFALWNVNTLLVHTIQVFLSPDQFQGTTGMLPRYFIPRSGLDIVYYFGKMDHLLCVPAALLLGLGLKKLDRSEQTAAHAS